MDTFGFTRGNIIKTNHGIFPIKSISFGDFMVTGIDGRLLWATNVEPVSLTSSILEMFGMVEEFNCDHSVWDFPFPDMDFEMYQDSDGFSIWAQSRNIHIKFAHELQNLYYLLRRKQLTFKKDE